MEDPGAAGLTGSWIRAARKARGYSIERLAAEVPMTKNQLSRIERGLVGPNGPHPSTVQNIERALDVPAGTLRKVAEGEDVPVDPDALSAEDAMWTQMSALVDELSGKVERLARKVGELDSQVDELRRQRSD